MRTNRVKREPLDARECPVCLTDFVPKTKKQKTCSAKCSGQLGAENRDYGAGKKKAGAW